MVRKTKAEAEETRLRILDAAEHLFFSNGVMQTSLEQIAAEAGVTRGAIYWHFQNKVDLFKALHERVRLPQEDIIERAVAEGHPDPLDLIRQMALDCLSLMAKDEQRQRIYTILLCRCEYVGEMVAALERQRDVNQQMRSNLVRILELAQKNKNLHPGWTPEMAARAFESMMSGLLIDWLKFGRSFDLVAVGTKCVTETLRAFRSEELQSAE